MRASRFIGVAVLLALGVIAALVACGGSFDPQSKVDSVRMFALRADKPYAKPGERVTLEVLMTDARKAKPRPLKLYWLPFVCMNPKDDLYYLCFVPGGDGGASGARLVPVDVTGDAGAGDAGAGPPEGSARDAGAPGAGAFGGIPTGVDIGPFLPQGTTFSFTMPEDAIQPREGIAPYGLAIVFNVACAGQIRLRERDPSAGPQQVPFACTDEEGRELPPSDYVIGFARVYSYADRENANPVIQGATLEGAPVDLAKGVTLPVCAAEKSIDCPEHAIDVVVSDASWEVDPGAEAHGGGTSREQIWVDYYADVGELGSEARLVFDATRGRGTDSAVKYRASKVPADGTLWAVVHDNRGGASWITVPLHVR